MGVTSFSAYTLSSSVPYTATIKTSTEQHLPDGNVIRGVTRTMAARDSAGRTMHQLPNGCYLDDNGQPQARLTVTVTDPNEKTWLSWRTGDQSDGKATLVRRMEQQSVATSTDSTAASRRQAALKRQAEESRTEDLGERTIAGVAAHGILVTKTIPAGAAGNELPLTITHEEWHAEHGGLVLLRVDNDPRRPQSTWEVQELSFAEPDPSLFAPPPSYQVVEQSTTTTVRSAATTAP